MTEDQAQKRLVEIYALLMEHSDSPKDLALDTGDNYVEHHMNTINEQSQGHWDKDLAGRYVKTLESTIVINE